MRYTYTLDQLQEAVNLSDTLAQVLSKLGIVPAGGNYATVKRRIVDNNINIDHLKGHAWAKGKQVGPKRPLKDYLVKGCNSINSSSLRGRLIREGIFPHQCSECSLSEWMSIPIPLELDHIDGDHFNNELSNLRLLCPNCHALTPTYRGKNIKK